MGNIFVTPPQIIFCTSVRKPAGSELTPHTASTLVSANMGKKRRCRGKDGGAKRGENGSV